MAAIDTTTRVGSPDISQIVNVQTSPLLNVQAPVFSPIGLPRPGKQIDELWSSREVSTRMYHVDGFLILFHSLEYSSTTPSSVSAIRPPSATLDRPTIILESETDRCHSS